MKNKITITNCGYCFKLKDWLYNPIPDKEIKKKYGKKVYLQGLPNTLFNRCILKLI